MKIPDLVVDIEDWEYAKWLIAFKAFPESYRGIGVHDIIKVDHFKKTQQLLQEVHAYSHHHISCTQKHKHTMPLSRKGS